MASAESLDDGQRAVLQLLLRQGKSYDEIAGLLHSDTGAIRRRAHGAVDALGPDGADVGSDRRNEIADYLLGQQTASQGAATREYLEASSAGRAWARSVADALAPLAGVDELPEIPAEREALDAPDAPTASQEEAERAAKRGSWLISAGLGVVLALVIIAVVYVVSSGGDDTATTAGGASTSTATTATTGPTATVPGDVQILAQGTLRPPRGSGSTASGQVAIVRFPSSNRFRLALSAKGLAPSGSGGSSYAVWFYTSKRQALLLGFPDKVVAAGGKLNTVADLSPDTPNFKEVLLTSERANAPKAPGPVVLRARLVTRAAPARTQTQTTP